MMLPEANFENSTWRATIDHLTPKFNDEKNLQSRPIKAAHAKCNHARHHYPLDHPKMIKYLDEINKRFQNPGFLTSIGIK